MNDSSPLLTGVFFFYYYFLLIMAFVLNTDSERINTVGYPRPFYAYIPWHLVRPLTPRVIKRALNQLPT